MTAAIPFVCPVCRQPVSREDEAWWCEACDRRYPIVLGIPDFRLTSDPWLSIEDDRAKGLALEARTRGASLRETVEAYWAMTPTTTRERAQRFTEHVLSAEVRSREWIEALGLDRVVDDTLWVDLGCGAADLASAIDRRRPVVAVDIAFRWLVVARRRLAERGLDNVTLVCADAADLPLPDDIAGRVLSLGLVEHLPTLAPTLIEAADILRPGGHLHLRTTNRYSLLPEPHVDVWGVGFVPARLADRYVKWRNGERYRYLHPTGAGRLRRAMRRAGLARVSVQAAAALPSDIARIGGRETAAAIYNRARTAPLVDRPLSWVAPLLDAHGVAR